MEYILATLLHRSLGFLEAHANEAGGQEDDQHDDGGKIGGDQEELFVGLCLLSFGWDQVDGEVHGSGVQAAHGQAGGGHGAGVDFFVLAYSGAGEDLCRRTDVGVESEALLEDKLDIVGGDGGVLDDGQYFPLVMGGGYFDVIVLDDGVDLLFATVDVAVGVVGVAAEIDVADEIEFVFAIDAEGDLGAVQQGDEDVCVEPVADFFRVYGACGGHDGHFDGEGFHAGEAEGLEEVVDFVAVGCADEDAFAAVAAGAVQAAVVQLGVFAGQYGAVAYFAAQEMDCCRASREVDDLLSMGLATMETTACRRPILSRLRRRRMAAASSVGLVMLPSVMAPCGTGASPALSSLRPCFVCLSRAALIRCSDISIPNAIFGLSIIRLSSGFQSAPGKVCFFPR